MFFRYYFTLALVISLFLPSEGVWAIDCNNNGTEDSQDILGSSKDCNSNGIPDECDVSVSGVVFGTSVEFSLGGISGGYATATPQHVEDLNNDHSPDLWGTGYDGYGNAWAIVQINDGTNNFESPQVFSFGLTRFNPASIVGHISQDVDSDGDLDIVLLVSSSTYAGTPPVTNSTSIYLLENDGTGTFERKTIALQDPFGSSLSLESGLYLVAASFSSANGKDLAIIADDRIYALYNLGSQSYRAFDMGASDNASVLVAGEFGGSGTALRAYERGGYVTELGAAKLVAQFTSPGDGSLKRESSVEELLSGNSHRWEELDGNATRKELVIAGPTSYSSYASSAGELQGISTAIIESKFPSTSLTSYSFFNSVVDSLTLSPAVDFDGDGDLDLPMLGGTASEVLLNDGNGDFSSRVRIFYPSTVDRLIGVADFNNDGKGDFLFKSATSGKGVIILNATTSFTPAVSTDRNANLIPDSCERAVPGDFTGDGKSDYVIVRGTGALTWFILDPRSNPNTAPYGALNPLGIEFGSISDTILAGDYDGVGKMQPCAVRDLNGSLVWRYRHADGTVEEPTFGVTGDYPLTGYFDSDSKLDRVVTRAENGNAHWFIKTSTNAEYDFTFGFTTDRPFTGDMDGDGIDEVIVARTEGGEIVWHIRKLNGTELTAVHWGLAGDYPLAPTNLDRDTTYDLSVVRNELGSLRWFRRFSGSFGDQADSYLGQSGDEPLISFLTGAHYADFSVRAQNDFETGSFTYGVFAGKLRNGGLLPRIPFGFRTDSVVGSDGRIVTPLGSLNGLACQSIVNFDGTGTYKWDARRNRSKARYKLPSSYKKKVSSVSLYSSGGTLLDTMKGSSTQFDARTYKGTQLKSLLATDEFLVAQTRLKSGGVVCQPVYDPSINWR